MRTDRCLEVEEFAALQEGEVRAGDREHLDGCPRCRARYAAYLRFMAGAGDVPAPEASQARHRLDEELRRRIEGISPPAPRPATRDARPRSFFGGWLRPALAAGVLVLVLALLPIFRAARHEAPVTPQLRGESVTSTPVRLDSPEAISGGGVRLRWRALAGATAYRVCLLDAELSEIATWEAGAETTWVLPAAELGRLQASDRVLAWRVRALCGQDEIGHSPPRPLASE